MEAIVGRLVAALLALLLVGPPSHAQSVKFPSVAADDVPAGPTITGWIYRPAGSGPFPAVILLHPCGGVDDMTTKWGKRLASWGFLTLAPDSFGPRGVKNSCTGPVVPPNNRVADVAGALDFLATQPDVAKGRIAVLGQSHGGKAALRAVQRRFNLAARGLRGAVAYYPAPCNVSQDKYIALPTLMFVGEKDDWVTMSECQGMATAVPPPRLQAVFYPGVGHAFDNDVAKLSSVACSKGTCHIGFDPKADQDAAVRTKAFLESILQ